MVFIDKMKLYLINKRTQGTINTMLSLDLAYIYLAFITNLTQHNTL